ncbi:MAG: ADP-ribosylglycohydrolase family protein, partial [Planctomycetia bacterium]|nr:ADP-ribosylglycohydrolase family protein [Planctomycetia bacterium]
EAFFTDDLHRIINAGLACIPAESQYAEMVRDLVAWHKQNPDQWQATWQLCKEKYRENPEYQKCSNGGIDVKINGACVLLGLLYGQGDMDQTIIISMRAGYDSDCNPSSAAGVLATAMGFQNLPKKFTEQLSQETVFSFTAYNFPQLLAVCEKLTRDAITRAGGSVEVDADGNEVFVIPVKQPEPPAYVASWEPGPVAESRYTEEEMKSIQFQPEEKK